jgi:hypothetical protein
MKKGAYSKLSVVLVHGAFADASSWRLPENGWLQAIAHASHAADGTPSRHSN